MDQQLFRSITNLFYNGQYLDGFREISQLIIKNPLNSILYSNRALFASQLGRDQQAIQDLILSVGLNPLNYIAYFNLFSIQSRNNEDQQALKSLCCSLSCIYLLRAKITKNLEDVDQAIDYSGNNIHAYMLKGLILLERKQYQQAAVIFDRAIKIDRNNKILRKLAFMAQHGFQKEWRYEVEENNPEETRKVQRRLISSIQIQDQYELMTKINYELSKFNKLYEQINDQFGDITQKVPKQSHISHNIETFMKEKSRVKSSPKESVIDKLKEEALDILYPDSQMKQPPIDSREKDFSEHSDLSQTKEQTLLHELNHSLPRNLMPNRENYYQTQLQAM